LANQPRITCRAGNTDKIWHTLRLGGVGYFIIKLWDEFRGATKLAGRRGNSLVQCCWQFSAGAIFVS
jgi:hypothetical protein